MIFGSGEISGFTLSRFPWQGQPSGLKAGIVWPEPGRMIRARTLFSTFLLL